MIGSKMGLAAAASLVALVSAMMGLVQAHTYHFGNNCPIVEPMPGFDMNRFLGNWHVIQKTSTSQKCIMYNYTRSDEPGEFTLTQDSDIPVLGLTSLKHEYHYTGRLTVPEPSTPARMTVRFPLSVAGTASHIVFATDYETYAGIFTCQRLALAHRQSATILSRRRDLEKVYVDKLRQKLAAFGVNPFDLSIVQQTDCPKGNNSLDVNVDPDTFTAENFGKLFKKAGEKIGDGVEWLGEKTGKAYDKITGKSSEERDELAEVAPGRPQQRPTTTKGQSGRSMDDDTNSIEWIP